ncbi:hypothetical protein AB3X52_00155 [Nocardioides sp. DS6]|uniref:Uncharacterized protein n=1 Tax=Nocardioides eburneus TaxID=3231482 RepID=A0ABV3SWF6_9ACTN
MRARTVALASAGVVAAAVVGIGGGYAAGQLDDRGTPPTPTPSTLRAAEPLPAMPELPIAKDLPYNDDLDYPALAVGLPYVSTTVRGAGHSWRLLVPQGWKKYPGSGQDPAGTVRWRPQDEPTTGGYVLRVLPLQARDTPTERRDLLQEKFDTSYRDVHVVKIEPDSIWFAYRTGDNFRRFNYFAWVVADGETNAGFELSVAGRSADQDGLADLLDKVARSARRVR